MGIDRSRLPDFEFVVPWWVRVPPEPPYSDQVSREIFEALTIYNLSSRLTGGEVIRQATIEFLQKRVQHLGQASSELRAE